MRPAIIVCYFLHGFLPLIRKSKSRLRYFIQSEWISGAQGLVYQARRASKVCSCRVFVSQVSVFYVLTTWCAQASIRASGGTCRARDLSQCGYGFCVLRLKVKGEASDFLFCFSGYAGSHRPEDCKTGEDAAASKIPTGASARYSGAVSDESQHHRHAQSQRFVARCVESAERIQRREIWRAFQHRQQSDAD